MKADQFQYRTYAAMETPIRSFEKLVTTPRNLLEHWAMVAGHPGLRTKGNLAALFVHAATQGKILPSVVELNRWPEQRGTHWSQRST